MPRPVVTVLAGAIATLALAVSLPGTAAAYTSYTQAPFAEHTNPYSFGQALAFMPDGRVVFPQDFKQGQGAQTYIANRDGHGIRCLTCELPAPNIVPDVRPQGDWILFHSWMGHKITLGAPGFGGIGSELYVMHPDGSHVTKIYSDPAANDGEGTDDYHAYWSPDGKRLVWTHFDGQLTSGAQGRWDVRVANFEVDNGKPELTDVRIVRPANGHWY